MWEKLPLFALAAVSAFITIRAQGAGGATGWYPLSIRVGNAIVSYASYVGKAFWPARLAVMYPHPGYSLRSWQVAAAFLLLLAITGLVMAGRRHRYLPVGWFWFLGTLVPMIGLKQVGAQAMADRYAYLPFVGLFIMVCWGVSDWAEQRHLLRGLAGRSQPRRLIGVDGGGSSSDWLLERPRDAVVARLAGHQRQLAGREQLRHGAAAAGTDGRRHSSLPGSGRDRPLRSPSAI